MDLEEELRRIHSEAESQLLAAHSAEQLEAARVKYLGSKGLLKAVQKRLPQVPAARKRQVGMRFNETSQQLAELWERRKEELARSSAVATPPFDPTPPGVRQRVGHLHPLTQLINEFCEVFEKLGFTVADGPEVETDWYNFEALNTPPDHPAREAQDTYYTTCGHLLRSQTSTVQIRVMEKLPGPPVRIVAPGRIYRNEKIDATHHATFHQIEGLWVDEGVSMADLKGCMALAMRALFGPETKVRFRPSFFPFTEPSAELDVQINLGAGAQWLEMAGCGMVHPHVLEAVGWDAEKYTGFAFGFGVDRLAMLKFGITDIRRFLESDLRLIRQF